jgi:phospholipase/carboxylesterase
MEIARLTLNDTTDVLSLPARTTVTSALILVHGRGASALDILGVTEHLKLPDSCVVIAPEARGGSWYPQRFIEPQAANEPALGAALSVLSEVRSYVENEYALEPAHITLVGFSQGACLVAEFLKRSPLRYRAAAIWSGGLIGTDDEVAANVLGSFGGLPVYLGCDEADFHIPKERVVATAAYLSEHEANVTLSLYTNLGHTIHPEGLAFLRQLLMK